MIFLTASSPSALSLLEDNLWTKRDDDLEKLYRKFLNTWENYFTEEEYQRRLEEAACQRMRNAMMMMNVNIQQTYLSTAFMTFAAQKYDSRTNKQHAKTSIHHVCFFTQDGFNADVCPLKWKALHSVV